MSPSGSPGDPVVLLERSDRAGWSVYDEPLEILSTDRRDRVHAVVERAEAAAADGLEACGFLSYEAASAFDPALRTRPAGALPLVWFALFEPGPPVAGDLGGIGAGDGFAHDEWTPSIEEADHRRAIERIRAWIARGDTYQVNYTLRLRTAFEGDPLAWFTHLTRGHRAGRAAWVDTGRHALLSLSPELFFDYAEGRLTTRPMKGTAPRGRTLAEDRAITERLRSSEKDRAENLMIVDMMRNDLGRVARPGSVEVASLWDVERYPTLFQMTSTCTAACDAPVSEVLAALFPSASITGAPKARTTELIAELETTPRGIYTGAIGSIGPGRRASFNVAIRTVHVDRELGRAEYGTGGGIVWDSRPDAEYRECLTKALVVTASEPEFALLETLRWEPEAGFHLLDRHLERLADSAEYFDRRCELAAVKRRLGHAVEGKRVSQRVRLTLARDGSIAIESHDLEPVRRDRRVAFARRPIDPADRFLFHKTTHRKVYDEARAEADGVDDVLLWNDRGEVTESTIANLVVRLGGELLTPPAESGLLAGTERAALLARGEVREARLTRDDVVRAERLFLINSVRGRMSAELVQPAETLAGGFS
ncbi:MAG: aminodeoxychorismate synthase component I [Thermoanaerobaculia bacterium]|nr:aminodeoxychorismate synthase component I [Thermoanaerobaculia bacterium]